MYGGFTEPGKAQEGTQWGCVPSNNCTSIRDLRLGEMPVSMAIPWKMLETARSNFADIAYLSLGEDGRFHGYTVENT